MNLPYRFALASALVLLSSAALAQSASIAGVPPAPTINVPPPPCEKPPTTAGLQPNPTDSKRWNKQIDDYKKCEVDFHNVLNEYIKSYTASTNALVEASNKYLADFNAYAVQVRKDNDMDEDEDQSPNGKTATAPTTAGHK